MAIDKDILDRLLANYEKPEDLTGENGVLRQLTKALMSAENGPSIRWLMLYHTNL
jgi:hypothetical protein